MAAHSISFCRAEYSTNDILSQTWPGLKKADVNSGGQYTIRRQSVDRKDLELISTRDGLSGIPRIKENPQSFNHSSFLFLIGTMEFMLSVDTLSKPPELSITFMGNALKNPGPKKVVQIMLAVSAALNLDCSVLLTDGVEEQVMGRRTLSGERLIDIVAERLVTPDELGPPILSLIREGFISENVLNHARNTGARVDLILGGYYVVSLLTD